MNSVLQLSIIRAIFIEQTTGKHTIAPNHLDLQTLNLGQIEEEDPQNNTQNGSELNQSMEETMRADRIESLDYHQKQISHLQNLIQQLFQLMQVYIVQGPYLLQDIVRKDTIGSMNKRQISPMQRRSQTPGASQQRHFKLANSVLINRALPNINVSNKDQQIPISNSVLLAHNSSSHQIGPSLTSKNEFLLTDNQTEITTEMYRADETHEQTNQTKKLSPKYQGINSRFNSSSRDLAIFQSNKRMLDETGQIGLNVTKYNSQSSEMNLIQHKNQNNSTEYISNSNQRYQSAMRSQENVSFYNATRAQMVNGSMFRESSIGSQFEMSPLEGVEPTKWTPNERFNNCQLCQREFGILKRKHHCRSCGMLICSACSPVKDFVYGYKDTKVRICQSCFTTKKLRQKQINNKKLFMSSSNSVSHKSQYKKQSFLTRNPIILMKK
eukprot:403363127